MPKKLILRNFCYLNPGDLKLPILKLLPGLATIVKLSKRQDLVLLKENNVHIHISPWLSKYICRRCHLHSFASGWHNLLERGKVLQARLLLLHGLMS